jgi:PAS domain S-box-containing protein
MAEVSNASRFTNTSLSAPALTNDVASRRPAAYAVALTAVGCAAAVQVLLQPTLGEQFLFITLLAAVVFAAYYGGHGPALTALLTGAAVVTVVTPYALYAFVGGDPAYQLELVLYGLVGYACIVLIDSLRVARDEAERSQGEKERELLCRRVLERELKEREEALRCTLAAIGDGVVTTDARGMIAFLNAAAQQRTGWALEEAKGKPLAQIFDDGQALGGASLADAATLSANAACNRRRGVLVGRDGSRRMVEHSVGRIRKDDGELLGTVVVFRDVV